MDLHSGKCNSPRGGKHFSRKFTYTPGPPPEIKRQSLKLYAIINILASC